MNEKEIKSRMLLCEIREQEYREVGNTKTADRYSKEKYKWQELLEKINPKKDEQLRDYKIGYEQIKRENQQLKSQLKQNMIENILSIDDIIFLKELGHKRKTQEKDGCADPVYWMIQDQTNNFTDDGEYTMFFDEDGEELYNTYNAFDKDNLEEFKKYINDNFNLDEDELECLNNFEDNAGLEEFIYLYDLDVNKRTFTREYFISYSSGPFLTKEACKNHLKDNYYHYSKNARTYGMVGWRNPEFQKLMEIVEKFDNIEIGVDYANITNKKEMV